MNEVGTPQERESSLHLYLYGAIAYGVAVVLFLMAIAFGPSAALFCALAFAFAFAIIARRYRFSLRTLLVVMTVLSVWLGLKLNRDAKLERALTGITSRGGHFMIESRQPNFPWGLWKYRYYVDYYGLQQPLTREDFANFATLAPDCVRGLDLTNTGITDEDLRFIEGCTGVETLSLANETYTSGELLPDRPQNKITDAGLARLARLTELHGLDLRGTDITDDGLRVLAEMPNLYWVYLDGSKVVGPGLAHLRSHQSLSMLELNGCQLTPAGYQELIQMPNLFSLGLRNSGATDDDLKLLEKNTQLGILRLDDTDVSDEAVQQFQQAHPNCKIER